MQPFFHEQIKILDNDLKQIEIENADLLKQAELSIYQIRHCLLLMKKYLFAHPFVNQVDEIHFFKVMKPYVYGKLIYFSKIFNIESKRPNGSDKSQKKYLQSELDKLDKFFTDNLEFYHYMRGNMTYIDDRYFVRGVLDIRLSLDSFSYDCDPEFSTSHDFKAAKILANDMLGVYLKTEIVVLDRKETINHKSYTISKGKYSWTDSKASLVELIYAIKASGCVNGGSIKITELTTFFEALFNIDLSDNYRTYLQIKDRQNQTKFLDTLKTTFLKKIEDQDD